MMEFEKIRAEITQFGISHLSVSDLLLSDLPELSWAGDSRHIENVERQMLADPLNQTLAVRTADGTVVAKGYVDHADNHTESNIGQLATHPELQSLGIGTLLMHGAESCIKSKEKNVAVLGVEVINVRAKALYERLGYAIRGQEKQGWDAVDEHGDIFYYETEVLIMSKLLI